MTAPYYQDSMVTIYHGDCMGILPELGRFDLLLTDIPYGKVSRENAGLRNLDRAEADVADFDLGDLVRHFGCGDSVYVFCGTEQVSTIRRGLVDNGYSTRACVWEKSNPSPMNGQHLWLSSIELCVYGKRAGAYFNGMCESPVWRGRTTPRPDHPTAKPEWLMRELVGKSCPPNGTVLDPFMGSGTTLDVCRQEGIRCVGIDREEKYCEIAAKRVSQMSLFE